MNEESWFPVGLFLCCLMLLGILLDRDHKLQYQRGLIEGLQQKQQQSQPQINVNQVNKNGGK